MLARIPKVALWLVAGTVLPALAAGADAPTLARIGADLEPLRGAFAAAGEQVRAVLLVAPT